MQILPEEDTIQEHGIMLPYSSRGLQQSRPEPHIGAVTSSLPHPSTASRAHASASGLAAAAQRSASPGIEMQKPPGFGQAPDSDWSGLGATVPQQYISHAGVQRPAPALEKRPSDLLHAVAQVTLEGFPSFCKAFLAFSARSGLAMHCCLEVSANRICLSAPKSSHCLLIAVNHLHAVHCKMRGTAAGKPAGEGAGQQHPAVQAVGDALSGHLPRRQPVAGRAQPSSGPAPRGLRGCCHDARPAIGALACAGPPQQRQHERPVGQAAAALPHDGGARVCWIPMAVHSHASAAAPTA